MNEWNIQPSYDTYTLEISDIKLWENVVTVFELVTMATS